MSLACATYQDLHPKSVPSKDSSIFINSEIISTKARTDQNVLPSPFGKTMGLISSVTSIYVFLVLLWVFSSSAGAKVFMVLMDEDAVVSYNTQQANLFYEDVVVYKKKTTTGHDNFLQSLLPDGSYTKLYSYTHLLNGFAVHTSSEEALKILREARGIRSIQEDLKLRKLTTHSPEFLGIPDGVWPRLGGAQNSGDGVVIGMLDSGINPDHPSFANQLGSGAPFSNGRFRGRCETGERFPPTACNGKIVAARHFSRGATVAGDFNATRDYASPFDVDGHGSHTASTAAGNSQIPVLVSGFNYGNASGIAPGARIAVYKAVFSFGGYMSDVVAAVDQAVEDGVDILSLSIGPQSVPSGTASFLNTLDIELLFAAKAGVFVVQAVGNEGPSSGTVLSFSPWIMSVASSTIDRKYNNSVILGNGQSLPGTGLSPPTTGDLLLPMASAADVSIRNATFPSIDNCQSPELFNPVLVRDKIIICTYSLDFTFNIANINSISDTMAEIGAAGFIIAIDPDLGNYHFKGITMTLSIPGIALNTYQSSQALWDYYNTNTLRKPSGLITFGAMVRILDGRLAVYTHQGPAVATYSSRGPDANNMQLQTADVLKPSIMAPGTSIWAAWSPTSQGDQYDKGQDFAMLSGTSMATPHIAGVAALIKNKHPSWSPAAISSAMMTSADTTDHSGFPILAQGVDDLATATPFDYGAGFVNPTYALNPGLVFDIEPMQYIQFLCAVPDVDSESVRRAVGTGCPSAPMEWCSDLNTPNVVIANLVGTRRVIRKVDNVAGEKEFYQVVVREPTGVTITVVPRVFAISVNASRILKITVQAVQATNTFSFGDMLLLGDKKHQVRIPLAVSVTSTLNS